LPHIEDLIDKIGQAKFISKLDLLAGYWQIPLTPRAKEISSFVTPDGFYQYQRMAFGLKNAPSTFQRMMNFIVSDINNCEAYIDDVVV
jgi:Reverse transcriptase (RNA-dependent DNA polymerase)